MIDAHGVVDGLAFRRQSDCLVNWCHIPNFDLPPGGGGKSHAVGAERDTGKRLSVALQYTNGLSVRRVPDSNSLVQARRCDALTIRAVGNPGDDVCMAT